MTYLTVSQIKLINAEIAAAKQGSPLYQKPAVEDPRDKLIAAHTATLEWHMQSRKFSMTAAELVKASEKVLTILRYHVREGHLQYLQKLRADLAGEDDDLSEPVPAVMEQVESERKKYAKNDSISCDLGLPYPLLQSIFAGHKNHQTLHVS